MYFRLSSTFLTKLDWRDAQAWQQAPSLSLRITYGSLRLSGSVPSEADKQRLLQRARESFGDTAVVDQLRVSPAAAPADWTDTAVSLLWLASKKLNNGAIDLDGATVRLLGTVSDAQTKQTLHDNVTAVLGEHVVYQESLKIVSIAHTSLLATLQRLLPSGILFSSNSAILAPTTKRALKRLAPLIARADAEIEIRGYADAVGAPAMSLRLSELRANAVRKELITLGVAPHLLTARGMGGVKSAQGRSAQLHLLEAN